MRIVELKSQNVKIIYKPTTHHLKVGDFISFSEDDILLVGQIYKIGTSPAADDFNQADINFVLCCKNGNMTAWNGETISAQATALKTDKIIIEKYINNNELERSFTVGNFLSYETASMYLNSKNFTTPAFIGFEKASDNRKITEIIAGQCFKLNQKLLIMDFKGNVEIPNSQKIIAGFHSKLPLNNALLENLSSRILDDVSMESRIVIEDILLEIASYTKESKNGFISLSHLINVVDETFKNTKIPQLMLLKNKLRKCQKLNIFADTRAEVHAIFNSLEQNDIVVYDVSQVALEWHKDFFNAILDLNNSLKKEFYLYATLDEQNSDNKLINNLLFKVQHCGIKAILSSNYRYLSFDNIYDFSQNTFLFKTNNALIQQPHISEIIKTLPNETVLISGKLTNNIPLCAILKNITAGVDMRGTNFIEKEDIEATKEKIEENLTPEPFSQPSMPEEANIMTNIDISSLDTAFSPEPAFNIQMPETSIKPTMIQVEKSEPVVEAVKQPQQKTPEEPQKVKPVQKTVEPKPVEPTVEAPQEVKLLVEPQQEEAILEEPTIEEEIIEEETVIEKIPDVPEELELPEELIEEEPIALELPQEEEIDLLESEALFEEIDELPTGENELENITLEDIDFVGENTSSASDDEDLFDLLAEAEENMANDNNIDDDIDLDDLLNEANNQMEDEEEFDYSPTSNLPVYGANYEEKKSTRTSEPEFSEGDLVRHQKYGVGTIKKITAHGDKYLCHINFDDFGRRLLDPEISQLEKI